MGRQEGVGGGQTATEDQHSCFDAVGLSGSSEEESLLDDDPCEQEVLSTGSMMTETSMRLSEALKGLLAAENGDDS